jgi:predicted phage-related endonuclease
MKTLNLIPGTPAWEAHRFNHFNASELAAAMGISKKLKRNELLHMKATGNEREFSTYVREVILASGHRAEAAIRPTIEAEIGETLYPMIGVSDEDPRLSVSFDGISAGEEIAMECKVWNEALVAQVRAGELREEDFPDHIYQMEQALLISTHTEEIIFTVAREDGSEHVSMRYRSVPERRAKIIPTWDQFEADLRAYVPPEPKAAPVAAAVETLPAIVYNIDRGTLSLTSNLPTVRTALSGLIERSKVTPVTDQDFVDLKALCKYLREVETNLKLKAEEAVGQIADIAEFSRSLKDMAEASRVGALAGEKLVEAEEKRRKQEIQQAGERDLALHIEQLNTRFSGRVRMPAVTGDFAGVIKGKRTLDSIQNAVDTELAKRKIEASAIADRISANLRALDELAADHLFLFNDLPTIACRETDSFEALVKLRVHEHKAKEQARLDAERERIAREEREKAEREARAKVEAEQKRLQESAPPPAAQAPAQKILADTLEQTDANVRAASEGRLGVTLAKTTVLPTTIDDQVADLPQKATGDVPRPTVREIVEAVADHFGVTEAIAAGWLATINQAELAKVA